MTSPANRQRPSSGSSGAFVLAALIGFAYPVDAVSEPVRTRTDHGVIDWTARTIAANGVGTPKVISPTGALTRRELYQVAREDAERRIAAVFSRLPVDPTQRLRDLDSLTARREAAARATTSEQTRHFSDGTVHLPVTASFAWIAAEWPVPADAVGARAGESTVDPALPVMVGPPLPGPTGLVIEMAGPIDPTVRVELTGADDRTRWIGTRADGIGVRGIIWSVGEGDLDTKAHIGNSPRRVKGQADGKRGRIRLADDAQDLLGDGHVPGGVLILFPEASK